MKRKLLIILLMVSLLLLSLYGWASLNRPDTSVVSKEISSMQSAYNKLLINTYLKKINEASDNFYKEYFTISPRVDYFVVSVKNISTDNSTNPTSTITFITEPFVDAHWTVGTDEISFSADYTGKIVLQEFNHIKSFSLPDRLKGIVIKPIPGKTD